MFVYFILGQNNLQVQYDGLYVYVGKCMQVCVPMYAWHCGQRRPQLCGARERSARVKMVEVHRLYVEEDEWW